MKLIEPTTTEHQLAIICRALGHPLRVAIVRYIAGHPRCICNDIVVRTDRAQSTISQHLRVLVQAGLVETEADGQTSTFWLAPQALSVLEAALEALTPKERPTVVPLQGRSF